MNSELPEDLRRFLDEHVRTPEQLEALHLMSKREGQLVSPDAVAQELGISVTAATIALTRLSAHRLLSARVGGQPIFEFKTGTPALGEQVRRLMATYEAHRLQVMSVITSNAAKRALPADLETFASAFLVRGKKNE